jgi:hypothetical protein
MPKAKPAVNPPKTPAKSPAPTKAAPKPHTSANAVVNVPAVLITGAQAAKLDLDGLAAGIRQADSAYRGAYAAFGIYRFYAEKQLTEGKVSPFLSKKCGLSASTISHTAYACKAYHWVASGHITEEEYNRMTSRDMTAFVQVMGANSKLRLKPQDAVPRLKKMLADGADIAAEFNAFYEHGCSLEALEKLAEEQARQDKLNGLIRDGRAALGDGKFKDARKAANAVLADEKDHAEAKRLLADIEDSEKAKKHGSNPPAAPTGNANPSNTGVTGPTEPESDAGAAPTNTGATGPTEPESTPTNITPMPPQKAKPTASDLGKMLDDLLLKLADASEEDQRVFITTSWAATDALLRAKVKPAKKKAA